MDRTLQLLVLKIPKLLLRSSFNYVKCCSILPETSTNHPSFICLSFNWVSVSPETESWKINHTYGATRLKTTKRKNYWDLDEKSFCSLFPVSTDHKTLFLITVSQCPWDTEHLTKLSFLSLIILLTKVLIWVHSL